MGAILVPVDFSDTSKKALHYAAKIAQATSKPLKVVHFFDTVVPFGVAYPPSSFIERASDESQAKISLELKEFTKDIHQLKYQDVNQELHIHLEVIKGDPIYQTEELCKEGKVDLIVMGTTGASGLAEIFGTVTYEVISRVTVPVLIVPAQCQVKEIKHIVYATNLGENESDTIDTLRELSEDFDASLTCLHFNTDYDDFDENRKQILDLSKKYAFTPINKLNFELIAKSSVEKGLVEYLDETNVDIITIKPEDRGFLASLFHTSLTKKLAYHSKMPVLVIKNTNSVTL
jgi:nucleotide-binding universal stress UspA family protein